MDEDITKRFGGMGLIDKMKPKMLLAPGPEKKPGGLMAGLMRGVVPKAPGPVQVATSPKALSAGRSLAKPMDQVRAEAYGGEGFSGPMPSGPPPEPMQRLASRAFNAPVQNQLGTMQFKNLQPRGGLDGLTARANTPPSAAGAAAPSPALSTNGYMSYVDEQIGAAGFMKSGADRKAGWVAQSGPYKGKTKEEADADLRVKFSAMSPEEQAQYEARANNRDIGDEGEASTIQQQMKGLLPPPVLKGVDAVPSAFDRRKRRPLGGLDEEMA